MYKNIFKRFFDIILSLFLLICFAPILGFIAIIVKLTSEGPIFFRQERGGLSGNYFKIMKFRTMAVDKNAEKKGFEPGSSNRITGIGKILRKTKLDELPQLINVIKGEMSLVGPRPEVRVYIELYPTRWENVLSTRPGVTDPASVRYRNEEEILALSDDPEAEYREVVLPHKLDIYEEYISAISFTQDVSIIVKTIIAVLLH